MNQAKHNIPLQPQDWRKRWHIARSGDDYTVFRLNAVPGTALVLPLPKGCRFTCEEREALIQGARASA